MTARALQGSELLAWYATGIYDRPDGVVRRLAGSLPIALERRITVPLQRFARPGLPPEKVISLGWHEWAERIAAKAGMRELARLLDERGNAAFGPMLVRKLDRELPAGLWGYNGSALSLFSHPAAKGSVKVLDRTIGDWREWNEILRHLQSEEPEWLLPRDQIVPQSRIDRDDEEFALADAVVCGASMVRETIVRHSQVSDIEDKVRVLPYCFDPNLFGAPPSRAERLNEPLRLLFVGHLSARKGVHHILRAIKCFSPRAVSLTLVGELAVPKRTFAPFADRVTWHRTVPRSGIPAMMRENDVLVLPSYFEGSAIVLLEALASGLAIIQTRQAGLGASAQSGIVLDRPDNDLLREAIERLLNDRPSIAGMQAAAQAEAREYSFQYYLANITNLARELTMVER